MADEHSERYPCDEEAALGAPSTGEGAHEMAQPVIPVPEVEAPGATTGTKRELDVKEEEQKAKQLKLWMDSPSKAVISDCLMVWAEDKSGLSPEEILGLHKGAHVATHNMGSFYMYTHTRCHSIETCQFMWWL